MRVLALSARIHGGGLETYVATISDALEHAGHTTHLATRDELGWSSEHDVPDGHAAQRLKTLAQTFSPDVIAIHNVLDSAVLQAARECGTRTVYHLHDHRVFCPNGDRVFPAGRKRCRSAMGKACVLHSLVHGCAYGPRPATIQLLERRMNAARQALQFDTIVVLSEFMKRMARANGAPRSRIAVLAPPIADAYYDRPFVQPDFTAPSVLFCGRAETVKGLQSLVRALALLPSTERPHLTVAGEGCDIEPAKALAAQLGVGVAFVGVLDRAGVIEAMDKSTMLAFPSLWDEPFGLSGVEAFARGRPVAAYDGGAIPEWIGEGGIAVRAGDVHALSRAIEDLLEPNRWHRASLTARSIASRYRVGQHIRDLTEIYGRPLEESAPKRGA
jgi:glycosyltransferase involved in cell wall biosynthesis